MTPYEVLTHLSDKVIPAALTDQQKPIDNIRTRTFFIVDNCLDETTLKNALDSLIRHHWRKLGARLVNRSSDGLLEYRLPHKFDDDYLLFKWSSTEFNHPIDECPELKLFHHPPPAEDGVAILDPVSEIEKVVRPDSWPLERKDEPPDAPMLYIHLSLFTDATVIATSVPHPLCDQFGLSNIMRAWLGLTRGETPTPMVGYNQDVLATGKEYNDYPSAETARKGKVRLFLPLEYWLVVLYFIPEVIIHPKEESSIIFFPRPCLQRLRERYTADLTEKYDLNPGLSNNDIIFGVLTKLARMHDPWARTMTLTQNMNRKFPLLILLILVLLRGRVPQLSSDEQKLGFLHNALYPGTARIRVNSSTPASDIAYLSRQIINEATEPDSKGIEIGMAVTREKVRRGQPTHVCEPFDRSYGTTNWCAAWRGLDLSCGTGTARSSTGSIADGGSSKMLILGQSKETKAPGRC
ncbi:hypothetical protein UA08_02300 [Talaromyces atroroseus]|uniref:Uncharacterized protein n=1 Tax=Talaromyces atroroseus TaxID=1441469 RepID=A0A225AJZ0_TALAT|nr:hypothetical protein UA08_02300 [Talaromyces atroroseus]OKL61842.1 hypothetical protein UA08_02300 [Talaromyces atroroseus]